MARRLFDPNRALALCLIKGHIEEAECSESGISSY